MISKAVSVLVEKQLENQLLQKEDVSVYRYGYTLIFEVAINILISCLIGILLGDMPAVITFLLVFMPLRSYAGGYHADKAWKCIILSNCVILLVILLSRADFLRYFQFLFIPAEILIGGLVCKLAPVQSKNKRIDDREAKYYKSVVIKIYVIQVMAGIILFILGVSKIVNIILLTHFVVLFSLAYAKRTEISYVLE